jgi:hypothetical protein
LDEERKAEWARLKFDLGEGKINAGKKIMQRKEAENKTTKKDGRVGSRLNKMESRPRKKDGQVESQPNKMESCLREEDGQVENRPKRNRSLFQDGQDKRRPRRIKGWNDGLSREDGGQDGGPARNSTIPR